MSFGFAMADIMLRVQRMNIIIIAIDMPDTSSKYTKVLIPGMNENQFVTLTR